MLMIKRFEKFEDGLRELKEASFSIDDCLRGSDTTTREDAINVLTQNVATHVSTHPDRVDEIELFMTSTEVQYRTSGGLRFGWLDYSDHKYSGWEFFVRHPHNNPLHESTLLQAFAEKGWEPSREEDEVVNLDEWYGEGA